jgi:hypothetical protein
LLDLSHVARSLREGDETASPFAFEALRSYEPRENVIPAVVMRLRLDALEKRK